MCIVSNALHIAYQHYRVSSIGINQWKAISGKIEQRVGSVSVCIKWICIQPLNLIVFTQEPSWFPDFECIKWGNASREVCIKWAVTVVSNTSYVVTICMPQSSCGPSLRQSNIHLQPPRCSVFKQVPLHPTFKIISGRTRCQLWRNDMLSDFLYMQEKVPKCRQ